MKSQMTDERIEKLALLLSQQLTTAIAVWELAMTILSINSREYRAICTAGKRTDKAYQQLRLLAEDRQWSSERLRQVFTVNGAYVWN